jgi:hypothetical protein
LNSAVTDIRLRDALISRQDSSEDEIGVKHELTVNVPGLERVQAGAIALVPDRLPTGRAVRV